MSESAPSLPPRVTVIGTLNIDHLWSVSRLPVPGQTLLAKHTRREFGGKGANQAVAAARQGARVHLVGAVGNDPDGQRYREHLDCQRIDTSGVLVDSQLATGTAHVYVDDKGENMIVVDAGANRLLDAGLVASVLDPLLKNTDVLLAQLECSLDAVAEALRMAHEQGVRTVLNASPFNADFSWATPINTVIVNVHECAEFFQQSVAALAGLSDGARRDFLRRHQAENLIVTRGDEPTLHFSADAVRTGPVHRVEPKDTVGAGDTFAGVLAVGLAANASWEDAIRHANVAAALSTLLPGAQSAMPTSAQMRAAGFPLKPAGGLPAKG